VKHLTHVRTVSGVAAAALALALLVAPAVASATAVIPGDPTVIGRHLGGRDAAYATEAIRTALIVPALAPLEVVVDETTLTLLPRRLVSIDITATVAAAFEPTAAATYELQPRYRVNEGALRRWLKGKSARIGRAAVNATYVLDARHRKLIAKKGVPGRRADVVAGTAVIAPVIVASAASGGATQTPVVVPMTDVAPKITTGKLGKAILVVLAQRRVNLYSHGRRSRSFRCAIGTPAHPTPTGTFKIVGKASMPSWRNPGSAWAIGMPAYIPPGPSNPLGTRALYLNSPGIRIHGTTKIGSIGTAASHGCMRMVRHDIETLYPLVPVGTPVFIIR
jgi:lipoprotein-anchoring transpeptidase ErfK/SrfK